MIQNHDKLSTRINYTSLPKSPHKLDLIKYVYSSIIPCNWPQQVWAHLENEPYLFRLEIKVWNTFQNIIQNLQLFVQRQASFWNVTAKISRDCHLSIVILEPIHEIGFFRKMIFKIQKDLNFETDFSSSK